MMGSAIAPGHVPGWGALARIAMAAGLALLAPLARSVCGVETGVTVTNDGREQRVRHLRDAVVFRSGLKINADGAANAYHPLGTDAGALDTICNGIAIIPRTGRWSGVRITAKAPRELGGPERCALILRAFNASRDANYKVSPDVDIDWYAIAMQGPPANGRYRPCVQGPNDPFPGFFVAQTSQLADPKLSVCRPEHWISSTEIPYIVLPGSRLRATGVRIGDLALVHRRVDGADLFSVAVAADSGNPGELGEGSIALHHKLRNFGRMPAGIRDGVTTFIFPRRLAKPPITSESIGSDSLRTTLLEALGGKESLVSCLNTR